MDFVSHGLIGFVLGGPLGAVASIAPDIPVMEAGSLQVITGDETWRAALLDHEHPARPRAGVRLLLLAGKLAHSWLLLPLLLLYAPPLAPWWALHLVLDGLTHRKTLPFFPFTWEMPGLVSWQHLPLWKYLLWIPLALAAIY